MRAPTVLRISTVEFPYTAQAEATNFKFLEREALSAIIGRYWQESQALVSRWFIR